MKKPFREMTLKEIYRLKYQQSFFKYRLKHGCRKVEPIPLSRLSILIWAGNLLLLFWIVCANYYTKGYKKGFSNGFGDATDTVKDVYKRAIDSSLSGKIIIDTTVFQTTGQTQKPNESSN